MSGVTRIHVQPPCSRPRRETPTERLRSARQPASDRLAPAENHNGRATLAREDDRRDPPRPLDESRAEDDTLPSLVLPDITATFSTKALEREPRGSNRDLDVGGRPPKSGRPDFDRSRQAGNPIGASIEAFEHDRSHTCRSAFDEERGTTRHTIRLDSCSGGAS
jgi:hypothetical protein